MTESTHAGGCNCRNIRYEFTGEPMMVAACHCLNCQRQGGAAFSVNLIIPDDRLTIHGDMKIYTDGDTETGKNVYRHFCANCGTPIISKSAQMEGASILKLGTLDERKGFAPNFHCWTETKFDWVDIPEGLPTSPRNPVME